MQVLKQVEQLRFTEMKVIGLQYASNEYPQKQWVGEEVECEIALLSIPNKEGERENKRVIKVAGKVLAPLSNESSSLPVGTTFKASITSDPSSSVVATTPKGNGLTIKQVKNFAYPDIQWQDENDRQLAVSLVKFKGKEVGLVSLNGSGLGILDKESEAMLREKKLLSTKILSFSAKLKSSPSTTANINVKPETVLYPWQQKDKEKELSDKRTLYREQYETYLSEFASKPKFAKATPKEIDIHVAARAIADIQDKVEVTSILLQSDVVRGWRATVSQSQTFEDYKKQARDYVNAIYNEANRRLHLKAEPSLKL